MTLTTTRAASLAEELDIGLDGICLACLSFVSAAVRQGDDAEVRRWVRRMLPGLWSDGLDAIVADAVHAKLAGDDAEAALADLERAGARSALARAIVLRLGLELAREEELRHALWAEVLRADAGGAAEWN